MADINTIGNQFIQFYYTTFDSNRSGLQPLYVRLYYQPFPFDLWLNLFFIHLWFWFGFVERCFDVKFWRTSVPRRAEYHREARGEYLSFAYICTWRDKEIRELIRCFRTSHSQRFNIKYPQRMSNLPTLLSLRSSYWWLDNCSYVFFVILNPFTIWIAIKVENEDKPLHFSQTFQLMPEGDSYYV